MKETKTYTVLRIENGFVEATSLKKAKKIVTTEGATIGYSSEEVIRETDADNKFWANMDIDKLKELKCLFDLRKPISPLLETINGRPNLSKITQLKQFDSFKEFKELIPNSNLEFETLTKNAACNIPTLICIAEMMYDKLKEDNDQGMLFQMVSNILWNIKIGDYGSQV
jgi:hypothetical protein